MSRCSQFQDLARCHGVVLLYHGAYAHVPDDLVRSFHNVAPQNIVRHLEELGQFFTFVDLAAFRGLEDRTGHAAVTFDDGNSSVVSDALPVLESLDLPATMFLNGANFEGETIWRDKIRYLINQGLVADFLAAADLGGEITEKNFYRRSKRPDTDGSAIACQLDIYAANLGLEWRGVQHNVTSASDLPLSSIFDYGNHTHHHYVMSSLDRSRQRRQILDTRNFITSTLNVTENPMFSLPFGDQRDFNEDTLELVSELGFGGMLLSRGRLVCPGDNPALIERVMPRHDDILEDLLNARQRSQG